MLQQQYCSAKLVLSLWEKPDISYVHDVSDLYFSPSFPSPARFLGCGIQIRDFFLSIIVFAMDEVSRLSSPPKWYGVVHDADTHHELSTDSESDLFSPVAGDGVGAKSSERDKNG